MRLTIVGARTLDPQIAEEAVVTALQELPPDSEVLLRMRRSGGMGDFEKMVERQAKDMGIQIDYCIPEGTGRRGTFARDMTMVERSDAVIAFFDPAHIMEGGTGNIVDKAVAEDVPCYAYEATEEGYAWIGGIEPPEDDDMLRLWNRRSGSPTRSSTVSIGG